jgi:hypothetical protein
MVCACCGGEMAADGLSCPCGARVVGPPLPEPEYVVPKLGRPIFALVLAAVSIPAFFWKWLLVPALAGLWLSRGALGKIKADPARFGGKRLAAAAMTLSVLVLASVAIYIIVGLPKYLRYRAESQRAATRAQMYRLAIALHEYKDKYGTYPGNLYRLQLEKEKPLDISDYWENKLEYQTTAEIAADSKSEVNQSPMIFNQYQIVSPGPDNKMGTADDLVMRDDIIVSPTKSDLQID